MKLWSDRLKPHTPFHVARRELIQEKWNNRLQEQADKGKENYGQLESRSGTYVQV